ncbi:MAG: hypothetical protein ACR2HH_02060 [Chthoniobacterales bacterium]
MNDRITRYYKAFKNLAAYGRNNADSFGPASALPGYFTGLDNIIQQMDPANADRLGGSGADVTDGLLTAVQTDLQLIGGLARSLEPSHPGMKDKFPTVGTTDQSILGTADHYLAELEIQPADTAAEQAAKTALQTLLVAHEMPADFVSHLREDRDAIAPSAEAEATVKNKKVKGTGTLDLLAHEGMNLRGLIVSGLRAKYSRQSDKLAAAESAAHVERAPQRAKKTPAQPTNSTPPTP